MKKDKPCADWIFAANDGDEKRVERNCWWMVCQRNKETRIGYYIQEGSKEGEAERGSWCGLMVVKRRTEGGNLGTIY